MKDEMLIELDGAVYLVTKKGGKTTRSQLDGKIVLQAFVAFLGDALDYYESKHRSDSKGTGRAGTAVRKQAAPAKPVRKPRGK